MVRNIRFFEMVAMAAIQPRWPIDENAMIFRSWVWFNPDQPLIKVEIMAISKRIELGSWLDVMKSKIMGGNFCAVAIIRAVVVSVPCITSGSQKCRGASPSFIARAKVNSVGAGCTVSCIMSHTPVCQALKMLENRIIDEAVA